MICKYTGGYTVNYIYTCILGNIQISTNFFVNRKNWLKHIFKN